MINQVFALIRAQTYVVEKWLDAPGDPRKKVSAKGLDRKTLMTQLRVAGSLVKHIEFLVEGLRELARPPAGGCIECKCRQQMAAELLAGKEL